MPASPLSSIYGAMRDSDSVGGHAGAQVVPRGKPAHGGVPASPRGHQSNFDDLPLTRLNPPKRALSVSF